eukprot:SAG11_NODE_294_length_11142_cov_7.050439_6_plen_78_part_00
MRRTGTNPLGYNLNSLGLARRLSTCNAYIECRYDYRFNQVIMIRAAEHRRIERHEDPTLVATKFSTYVLNSVLRLLS